jgi:hypothetical protein
MHPYIYVTVRTSCETVSLAQKVNTREEKCIVHVKFHLSLVTFQVLTAESMKMAVF